jgi:hypothetical protein
MHCGSIIIFGETMSDRHQILDDQEFWTRLEYDASRWLETSSDRALRRYWVDGFVPANAINTKRGLDVEGVAWVMGGGNGEYRFIASVPQKLLHGKSQSFEIESLSVDEDQHLLEVVVACRKAIAEAGAAPNGGPAQPSGIPGVGSGPPLLS